MPPWSSASCVRRDWISRRSRRKNKRTFVGALDSLAPDLILSDYSLPGFDGLSALGLARTRLPDVPVVIVSGAIGEETAIDVLKAGATDYVLKQRLSRLGPVVKRASRKPNCWPSNAASRRLCGRAKRNSGC